jgi:hypothetical protein
MRADRRSTPRGRGPPAHQQGRACRRRLDGAARTTSSASNRFSILHGWPVGTVGEDAAGTGSTSGNARHSHRTGRVDPLALRSASHPGSALRARPRRRLRRWAPIPSSSMSAWTAPSGHYAVLPGPSWATDGEGTATVCGRRGGFPGEREVLRRRLNQEPLAREAWTTSLGRR